MRDAGKAARVTHKSNSRRKRRCVGGAAVPMAHAAAVQMKQWTLAIFIFPARAAAPRR
jgi:hypothetical protein